MPSEPARRAEVRIFVDWFNRVWKTYPNGIDGGIGDSPEHAAGMLRPIDLFEALLGGSDFLFGEFGLADVIALPLGVARIDALPRG